MVSAWKTNTRNHAKTFSRSLGESCGKLDICNTDETKETNGMV